MTNRLRRVGRAAAVVTFATAVLLAFAPVPSAAQAPEDTGWWSRRLPFSGDVEGASATRAVPFDATGSRQVGPVTTLPNPVTVPTVPDPPVTLPEDPGPGTPNPVVPEGGLWVANDPTGPIAISAVRFTGAIGSADLTLRFAAGSSTPGPVVACPALVPFTPGPAGAWVDRPAHDCARLAISGRLSADGASVQFSLPTGFAPPNQDTLDVVLIPAESNGEPFTLYFEAPDDASLDVLSAPPTTSPTTTFSPPTGFDPGSSGSPGAPSAGGFTSGGTGSSGTAGGANVADAGSPVAAPPQSPIADLFSPFVENRAARVAAVATLLAMASAFWFFGGAPTRQPQLLGALAGDTPALIDIPDGRGRGIGRFNRPRLGPPTRL